MSSVCCLACNGNSILDNLQYSLHSGHTGLALQAFGLSSVHLKGHCMPHLASLIFSFGLKFAAEVIHFLGKTCLVSNVLCKQCIANLVSILQHLQCPVSPALKLSLCCLTGVPEGALQLCFKLILQLPHIVLCMALYQSLSAQKYAKRTVSVYRRASYNTESMSWGWPLTFWNCMAALVASTSL